MSRLPSPHSPDDHSNPAALSQLDLKKNKKVMFSAITFEDVVPPDSILKVNNPFN